VNQPLPELENLFAYRGEAQILLSLSSVRPLRFSEVAARVYERSSVRISDTVITRSLTRLRSQGLLTTDDKDPRHRTYALTSKGEARASIIIVLAQTLTEHERNTLAEQEEHPHGNPDRA
jgi:DNA-binding HxlR family transcriptional regulator